MPAPLPNSAAMDALVEELLTKDVYIVDYLPRTVPQNSGGQYFDVEYHLLNSPRHTALKDKFSSVIFKLKRCFSARRKRNAGNTCYSCANRRTFTPLRP